MRKGVFLLMIVAGFAGVQNLVWADDLLETEILNSEARAIVKSFANDLQSTLKTTLQTEGPISAIQVCHSDALSIAESHSDGGWTVSRTALKVRNSENAPDVWESETLLVFEKRLAKGESISTLEASKRTVTEFRYMKAIPTVEVCTVCHGVNLAPNISEALYRLYPYDKARGFVPGAIRGAFSLTKNLSSD